MALLLSAAAVFLRDLFYIYGIVLTVWTYLTPIMYDISMIGSAPLIALILVFRDKIMAGVSRGGTKG